MVKSLRPINLLPVREQIASVLRKAILTKEFQEGTVITLDEVANQLGVSSTPVREAFQILARNGFIKLSYNKRAEVLGINAKFIKDHYQIRVLLEQAAAGLVCTNGADLSEIELAFDLGKDAIARADFSDYSNYNQAFHMSIWSAAANTKMKMILSEMWSGLSIGSNVSDEQYAIMSSAEHANILKALQQRDESLAKELMQKHIMRSMEDMLTRFK